MRTTLLCTVGTSLFGNLQRLNDTPDNQKVLKEYYERQNWSQLAKSLLNLDPKERICGAEINTIFEASKKNWLDLKNIVFLVSDTQAGKDTGAVLKHYFENHPRLNLQKVEIKPIEQLQDIHPGHFKTKGLRNLVRVLGEHVQRFGENQVAIDATGGYKAQIAVAVLMGQALNIPVYYKHERFSEIIDFPPLPIAMDYDILGKNAGLLTEFEKGKTFAQSEFDGLDEKLRVFLTEVEIDGEVLYELNAIGQLYLTAFRLRYPKIVNLVAAKHEERKGPTFGNDHHYPNSFKEFVRKVWKENNWIKTCHSTDYSGQQGIKDIGFFVRPQGEAVELIGTYKEKDFGARFVIRLTDESRQGLNWAALRLNDKYQ
jgi:putative CRISPR-associated protein (TIGR02619 family)